MMIMIVGPDTTCKIEVPRLLGYFLKKYMRVISVKADNELSGKPCDFVYFDEAGEVSFDTGGKGE